MLYGTVQLAAAQLSSVAAAVTVRRPYGVKFSACVVYVPSTDIFPKVNQITY
jgi:hypothetical protein